MALGWPRLGAAEQIGLRPRSGPTMAELPAWLRDHLPTLADRTVRIALIGCQPDARDARLRPDGGFSLCQPEGTQPAPSLRDTEIAIWLRLAAPRVTLTTVPTSIVPDSEKDQVLSDAIHWVLRQSPDVISLPRLAFPHEPDGASRSAQAIRDGWKQGCVFVTLDPARSISVLPGILAIKVVGSQAVAPDAVPPEEVWKRRVVLGLPRELLEGRPQSWDEARSAVAYLTLTIAAIPAEGPLAHLERAGLISLTAPTYPISGEGWDAVRLIDVRSIANAASRDGRLVFMNRVFTWESRVRDVDQLLNIQHHFKGADEGERRINAVVRGDARLRHLAAAAQLTALEPIFLVSTPEPAGIATFRVDAARPEQRTAQALECLRTLESREDARLPFLSASRDAFVKINP
jgi:hypothetical protein